MRDFINKNNEKEAIEIPKKAERPSLSKGPQIHIFALHLTLFFLGKKAKAISYFIVKILSNISNPDLIFRRKLWSTMIILMYMQDLLVTEDIVSIQTQGFHGLSLILIINNNLLSIEW